MSSRDDILARIRKNHPRSQPMPEMPTFDAGMEPLLERFKAAVIRMGGKSSTLPPTVIWRR